MRIDVNVQPKWHSAALVSRPGTLPVAVIDRQDAGPTVYFYDFDGSLGRGALACEPFLTAEANLGRHTGLPLQQSRNRLESVNFNAHQFREPSSLCHSSPTPLHGPRRCPG